MPIIFLTDRQISNDRAGHEAWSAGVLDQAVRPISLLAAFACLERSAAARGGEPCQVANGVRVAQPREREVMTLVVSGMLNKRVGGELGISEITVKAHRGR